MRGGGTEEYEAEEGSWRWMMSVMAELSADANPKTEVELRIEA